MAAVTNQYEAMFLFGPSALADLDGAIGAAKAMVERHGGTVLLIKKWDERKLAYEIKKQKRGTYIICFYTGPGAAVAAILRKTVTSPVIVRTPAGESLRLRWDDSVYLTGPAEIVGAGEFYI